MAEAVVFPSLHDAEDSTLIEAVRAGNLDAYGVLYYRHCTAAMNLARRFTASQSQAEDLVAESFTAVLDALRRGKGPTDNFPAYLTTAVRNLSARWAERGKRMCTVEDLEVAVDSVNRSPAAEETILDLSERELVAGAFRRLPERDRKVLWLVDVEDNSYADAAVQMGMTTHALGTLLSRAREGLRDQFVASHIEVKTGINKNFSMGSPGYQRPGSVPFGAKEVAGAESVAASALNHPSALRLSRYARGKTPPRYRPTIEQHLAVCPRCRLLVKEAHEVGSTVRGLIAPMLLAPFVLDPPAGAPPAPVAPFPVATGLLSGRGSWQSARTVYLGVGATVIVVVLIFALLQVLPKDPEELDDQAGARSAPVPSETATDSPSAASGLTITWDRGDTTDVPAGRSLRLPFTISATEAVPTTASVTFVVPDGARVVTKSPACTTNARTIVCGGIGPFDEGHQMHGILVVDLGSSGPPPVASIVADGSWPTTKGDEPDANSVTSDGGFTKFTAGKDDVTIKSSSVPMFGTTTIDRDGRIVQYTPNQGYRGVDGFTMTVVDEIGQTAPSSIGVVVTAAEQ